MPAGGEVEPHKSVAGLHQRHEHFGIGRGAGMRLHIGKAAAEQFGDAVDRKPLGDIDILAAAVIALAGQTFGIFVGQHRTLRLKHGAADDVLGRDQLDLVALAMKLELDGLGDLGIAVGDSGREEILFGNIGLVGDRHNAFLACGSCFGLPRSARPGKTLERVIHRRPGSRQRETARLDTKAWDISAYTAAIFRDFGGAAASGHPPRVCARVSWLRVSPGRPGRRANRCLRGTARRRRMPTRR